MAAPDYPAIKHEDRSDGNPALGQPFFRFLDCGL
jgi:hypothetical protein